MDDTPGPWRRDTIDAIIGQARQLDETEHLLRVLLADADDAQLQLVKLSLLATQRRVERYQAARMSTILAERYGPQE